MFGMLITLFIFVALICIIDFSVFFLNEDTEKLLYVDDDTITDSLDEGVKKDILDDESVNTMNGVDNSNVSRDVEDLAKQFVAEVERSSNDTTESKPGNIKLDDVVI